jgi:hypothetical protein
MIGNDQKSRTERLGLFEQHSQCKPIGEFAMDERHEDDTAMLVRYRRNRGIQIGRVHRIDGAGDVENTDRAATLASETDQNHPL